MGDSKLLICHNGPDNRKCYHVSPSESESWGKYGSILLTELLQMYSAIFRVRSTNREAGKLTIL